MKRLYLLVLLMAVSGLLFSCVHTGRPLFQKPQKPVQTAKKESRPQIPPPKPVPAKEKEPPRPELVLKEARECVLKGDYEEAFDLYRAALAGDPGAASRNPYLEIFEWMREGADGAYEKQDCARAGSAYGLLSINYPDAGNLSFSQGYLKERIKYCSKTLTEEGLAEYREGNLEKALLKWRSALKFDPGNEEARKASETTGVQMKNLKKEKP